VAAARGCRSQRLRLQVAALQKNGANTFHFVKRATDVARFELDSSTAVQDNVRIEPELARIQRAVLDAVVQGESEQINVVD
jgi:hypothetical protein